MEMEYVKILVNITIWHLKPYWVRYKVSGNNLSEFGFLCFKLIITWKD